MNNSGPKTQPWGTPGVQDDGSRGFVPNSYYLGSISEEVQYSVAQWGVDAYWAKIYHQVLGDDCVKGGAEISEEHPHIIVFVPPNAPGSDEMLLLWRHRWSG